MTASLNPLLIDAAVRAALAEDLGRAGDITSQATIPADATAHGVIAARKPGIICGLPLARAAFAVMDIGLVFASEVEDGATILPGDVVARISGPARAMLGAERVALNYLGRLSGIATLTQDYVRQIAGTQAKICCTRKTTPGLRAFEKYAVRCGGGMNHRFGLDDAFLIKDNHIAVCGGVVAALRAAKTAAGHLVKIEIEVDDLAQLREVLAEGADVVLLDNMDLAMLRTAVTMVAAAQMSGSTALMRTEASGGVSLASVRAIAETGVDMISVGALTHSAPVLDLGLDIAIDAPRQELPLAVTAQNRHVGDEIK